MENVKVVYQMVAPESDLPPVVTNCEFITIEEAKRRGLQVPERAGSTIQLFAYKQPEQSVTIDL